MRNETSASPKAPLHAGTHLLGEYVIGREVERGPVWTVYQARHAERERERFLLRVLNDDALGRTEVLAGFAAGVERLARLAHPSIVSIVAGGVDRGVAVVVTRELIGTTLRARLARSGPRMSVEEIARLVTELGTALDYLHAQQPQVVHCRLNTSCVFLAAPSGSVRLLGLDDVRPAGGHPSADQFALASIVYECLTGLLPFPDEASLEGSRKQVAPTLSLTGELAAKRADLEWVLHRAWSPDPSRRFASAGRLASEVARLLVGDEAVVRAAVPPVVPASGSFVATRPVSPSGSRIPAIKDAPVGPAIRASAPVTPPSGERPAIRSNTGQYAMHLGTRSKPSVAATPVAMPRLPPLPSPSGERPAVRPPPARVEATHVPVAVHSEIANVPGEPAGPPPRVPPPLPSAALRARPAQPAPPISTPTLIGTPVMPSPPPSLLADLDPTPDESPAMSLTPLPDEAPAAAIPPLPVIAIVPEPPRLEVAPPRVIAPEAPRLEIQPNSVMAPIPLLAEKPEGEKAPVTANVTSVATVHTPRRRPLQLVAASLLALVFGGERLMPHARRAYARIANLIAARSAPASRAHVAPHRVEAAVEAAAPAETVTAPLLNDAVAPVAQVAAEPVDTVTPAPVPAPVARAVGRRPSDQDRAQVSAALHQVITSCATPGHRDHRHARFTVTFEGATGAAIGVAFPDQFFRTHVLGTCITDGARRLTVPPFSDHHWIGAYSIMVP